MVYMYRTQVGRRIQLFFFFGVLFYVPVWGVVSVPSLQKCQTLFAYFMGVRIQAVLISMPVYELVMCVLQLYLCSIC